MTLFTDLLADPYAERIFLLEALPYDPVSASLKTIRFSSLSSSSTVPIYNNFHWPARLDLTINQATEIFKGSFGGINPSPTGGQIQISIADGENDAILDYVWDGRDITIYMGGPTFAWADFGIIFKGTALDASWTETVLTLKIRDFAEVLKKPVQESTYLGTGGLEGTADLKDVVKPISFGSPRNIEPVLLDRITQLYQFNDGASQAVDNVYDKGVALTKANGGANDIVDLALASINDWIPIGGQYITDLANGLIRLGAEPDGPLTADVQGFNTGGFIQSTSDIIKQIIIGGELTTADLDLASFTQLNTDNSSAISVYLKAENPTRFDLINQLMVTIGGFWFWDKSRKLKVGQFKFGTSVATYDETDILTIKRIDTPVPLWSLRMGYARSFTIQDQSEISKVCTSQALADFVKTKYRYVTAADAAIKTRRVLAKKIDVFSTYDTQANAQVEVDRQFALLNVDRDFYQIKFWGIQFVRELGETITIKHPRFGLSAGKDGIISKLGENTKDGTTTMNVWI